MSSSHCVSCMHHGNVSLKTPHKTITISWQDVPADLCTHHNVSLAAQMIDGEIGQHVCKLNSLLMVIYLSRCLSPNSNEIQLKLTVQKLSYCLCWNYCHTVCWWEVSKFQKRKNFRSTSQKSQQLWVRCGEAHRQPSAFRTSRETQQERKEDSF